MPARCERGTRGREVVAEGGGVTPVRPAGGWPSAPKHPHRAARVAAESHTLTVEVPVLRDALRREVDPVEVREVAAGVATVVAVRAEARERVETHGARHVGAQLEVHAACTLDRVAGDHWLDLVRASPRWRHRGRGLPDSGNSAHPAPTNARRSTACAAASSTQRGAGVVARTAHSAAKVGGRSGEGRAVDTGQDDLAVLVPHPQLQEVQAAAGGMRGAYGSGGT
jgi:hypothetical protein